MAPTCKGDDVPGLLTFPVEGLFPDSNDLGHTRSNDTLWASLQPEGFCVSDARRRREVGVDM